MKTTASSRNSPWVFLTPHPCLHPSLGPGAGTHLAGARCRALHCTGPGRRRGFGYDTSCALEKIFGVRSGRLPRDGQPCLSLPLSSSSGHHGHGQRQCFPRRRPLAPSAAAGCPRGQATEPPNWLRATHPLALHFGKTLKACSLKTASHLCTE